MPIRIHPIETGHARIRQRFKRAVAGPLRQAAIMTGPWTEAIPILAWAIEHDEGVIMVDTGARADVRDTPFSRFEVGPEEEIAPQLRERGIEPGDVRTVVITHLHGDHVDGVGAFPNARVLVSAAELRFSATMQAKIGRRIAHQTLPDGFAPTAVDFDGPGIGAFGASHAVTEKGDIVIVPAPGHTPGHSAVLVVEGDLHRLIAGDSSYDQQQLLDLHPDGVSPKPSVARETMRTIIRHGELHPTVYLPTHDAGSPARLTADVVLPATSG